MSSETEVPTERKIGRPPKIGVARRDGIFVRVLPGEKLVYHAVARSRGLGLAELIRQMMAREMVRQLEPDETQT